jgi:putative phosphoribosyl transferase
MNLTSEDYKERLFPISSNSVRLEADLVIPPQAESLVLLIHSTRSRRYSSNCHAIAEIFHQFGLATLAIDLLTLHEEASDLHSRYLLFNANLLADRLKGVTDWLMQQPSLRGFKIAYFGIGIEAGAALLTAAHYPHLVRAIACVNGRADLATAVLPEITMPTLLMVGKEDSLTQRINQNALVKIQAEKRLEEIAGASLINEQPEVLKTIAGMAAQWFKQHLGDAELKPEEQLVEI